MPIQRTPPRNGPRRPRALTLAIAAATFATLSALAAGDDFARGRILLPDGSPAANARIHAVFFPRETAPRDASTKTDADGRFEIATKVSRGEERCLTIDAPGCSIFVVRLASPFRAVLVTNRFDPVRLTPDRPLRGRVIDEEGRPVPVARVSTATLQPHSYMPFPLVGAAPGIWPELGAITAKDGSFVLRGIDVPAQSGLMADHVRLVVETRDRRHGSSAETTFSRLPRDDGSPATNPVVVVHPDFAVAGRVVDELTGKPVDGARIAARGTGAMRFEPVVTGAKGLFSFRRIPSFARLQLDVSHRDHAPTVVQQTTSGPSVTQRESTNTFEIRLGTYVEFSGRIVDAETKGATLVPVEWSASMERALTNGCVQRTVPADGDSSAKLPPDGTFRTRLPAGRAVFQVEIAYAAGAYRKAYDHAFTIEIPRGGATNNVLELPRKPGVLVRMDPDDAGKARRSGPEKNLVIEVREEHGNSYSFAEDVPLWFYPVSDWGKAMETRMLRRTTRADGNTDETEAQPWTRIVADPKTWPVTLRVP